MADRQISIRLAVVDGNKTKAELRSVGDEGDKSLNKIAAAGKPASSALKAIDAASRDLDGQFGSLTTRLGPAAAALRALGPVGVGVAVGLGAIAGVIAAGLPQFAEAERMALRLEQVLRATGHASGLTAREIRTLADETERATFATAEEVQEAAAVLATFRSVQGDTFRQTLVLAQDLSAVFGQSLTSSVTQLGKALEDPIQGISALRRVGVSFSATQREMIEGMVRAGDIASAQRLILETLAKQVGGAGAAEASGLAGAFDRAKDAVGNFLEGIVEVTGIAGTTEAALERIAGGIERVNDDLFTDQPIGEQVVAANRELIEAQDRLATLEERLGDMTGRARAIAEAQARQLREEVADLEAEVEALIERGRAEVAEMERAEAGRAAAEADARTETALGRLRELKDELEGLGTTDEKIAAVNVKLADTVEQLNALRNPDGSNVTAIHDAINAATEIAHRRIEALEKPARDAAERQAETTKRLLDDLGRAIDTFGDKRAEFIQGYLKRLGEGVTPEVRTEVEALANRLYDLKHAETAAAEATRSRSELMSEGKAVTEANRTATERYADEIARLNGLLAAGAIDQDTYARAADAAAEALATANRAALQSSTDAQSGLKRAIDDYLATVRDSAKRAEDFLKDAFSGIEDAIVQFATTGKLEIRSLADSIVADLIRIQVQKYITGPLAGLLGGLVGSGSGSSLFTGLFHDGGPVTAGAGASRGPAPAFAFEGAPRLHGGGMMLRPDEVPAILQTGERVLSRREVAELGRERSSALAPMVVTFNVTTPDAGSFRRAQGQIAAEMTAALERARRNL
jgi:lambda family phage tail tape measure protein